MPSKALELQKRVAFPNLTEIKHLGYLFGLTVIAQQNGHHVGVYIKPYIRDNRPIDLFLLSMRDIKFVPELEQLHLVYGVVCYITNMSKCPIIVDVGLQVPDEFHFLCNPSKER